MPLLQDRRYNTYNFYASVTGQTLYIITFMPLLQNSRYYTYNIYASVTRQSLLYI